MPARMDDSIPMATTMMDTTTATATLRSTLRHILPAVRSLTVARARHQANLAPGHPLLQDTVTEMPIAEVRVRGRSTGRPSSTRTIRMTMSHCLRRRILNGMITACTRVAEQVIIRAWCSETVNGSRIWISDTCYRCFQTRLRVDSMSEGGRRRGQTAYMAEEKVDRGRRGKVAWIGEQERKRFWGRTGNPCRRISGEFRLSYESAGEE